MRVPIIYAMLAAVAVAIPHGGNMKVSSLGLARQFVERTNYPRLPVSSEILLLEIILTNNLETGTILQLLHVNVLYDNAYEALDPDGRSYSNLLSFDAGCDDG